VASVLTAGGDFRSQAGRDTTLVASKISAGNEAYLYSGEQMNLLAAENSTHTLYDMKEKGSWGAKKAQMDEVTRTTQVGTEIKAGGNLTLKSNGDQLYQVAKLNSGKDIILDSSGAIVFEGVKDLHDESHTKSKSDLSWFSAKGKGNTDETLRQSELVAQGQLVIKAAEGIRIDVKQVDQQTVSQTVDAMVKADPNLAWLKQAEARGDIDWRQVKEIHESFKYDNSGLGAGAKIAIAIMMAAIMGPAGFGLGGWQLAVATSFSTTGVTSTINNKGNLGRALKETVSTDSLKSAAVAGFTAGALEYADTNWFAGADKAGASTSTVQGVNPSAGSTLAVTNSSKDIFTWTSAGDIALRTGGRAVISSGISTAIQGGSFGRQFQCCLAGRGWQRCDGYRVLIGWVTTSPSRMEVLKRSLLMH
jgi:filamentous hemagglutinin